MDIRPVRKTDASAFLELTRLLDEETKMMMLEPGERDWSVRDQREMLVELARNPKEVAFVAEVGPRLVGYVSATGGAYRRNAHKARLVIGIMDEFAGKGLGTELMQRVEDWARERGLRRLELTVMKHNERAVALYRKVGFVVEGELTDSLRVGGSYVDELAMAKLLNPIPS